MNARATIDFKKKVGTTITPGRGLMPFHPPSLPEAMDGLPASAAEMSLHGGQEPVRVHDFSQIPVHSPAKHLQACPLAFATPRACPFGGACHTCPTRVQAKLTVNQPGDEYEQEADRVADQVMRMPEPMVQRACLPCDEEDAVQAKLVDGGTLQRQEEEPEEEEESVQTKATPGTTPVVTPRVQAGIEALRGGGQPLSASDRAFFEPRFGVDFSQVRVHTDASAAESARAVAARAYTFGRDIVFGTEQFQPTVFDGHRLLAHELTHVMQQNSARLHLQRDDKPRMPPQQPKERPPIGPIKPEGSPADFCTPYTNVTKAFLVYAAVKEAWLLYATAFGSEVRDLWKEYLTRKKGDSLTRRVFRDGSSSVVQAFMIDPETVKHANTILDSVAARARSMPEAKLSVPGTSGPFDIPKQKLDMHFENPATEIPGNIAGGPDPLGSDAGPDERFVVGKFVISRTGDDPKHMTKEIVAILDFTILDCVDLCPGGPGGWAAQRMTIPMSRLEATPWMPVYDMPFEVAFKARGRRKL